MQEHGNVSLCCKLSSISEPGKTDDIVLPPGSYKYPFSFALPPGIPTSYEAKIGRVRYFIQATIDRPWAFDDNTRTPFTVANLLDLNTRPDLLVRSFMNKPRVFPKSLKI